MKDKDEAKKVNIVDYLSSQGYNPVSSRGKYHKYLSPLHRETDPSFFVSKDGKSWWDYGLGLKNLDVLDLVMRHEHKTFPEAVKSLLKEDIPKKAVVVEAKGPAIEVRDVQPLTDERLIAYLIGRKVDIDLARIWCKQVSVSFVYGKNPEKAHLYVGFENDKGGFELRNSYSKIGKVSTSPKYFTRIEGLEYKYNFFEGFINYLNMLKMYKTQRFKNTTVILNSLVNMMYLYETMKNNLVNNLFLDNDETAQKYIVTGDPDMNIESLVQKGIIYTDQRGLFGSAGDINDFVMGKFSL